MRFEQTDIGSPDNCYVYCADGGSVGPPVCRKYEFFTDFDFDLTESKTSAFLTRVPPNWGDVPPFQRQFVYETTVDGQARTYRCNFNTSDDIISGSGSFLVVPVSAGPGVLLPPKESEDIQGHRENIQADFEANDDVARSTMVYLEETYYFVPLYLALQLLASGEYVAALDWFRTIYDYTQPAKPVNKINKRKIYHGLVREESLDVFFNRDPSGWLLDPLDPHSIAGLRGNAYTRFTLLSIIRCLLEYADSEFTRDTAESVPRARTLYLTALELLDSADLKKLTPSCDDEIKTSLDGFGDEAFKTSLQLINDRSALGDVLEKVKQVLAGDDTLENRRDAARLLVEQATIDLQPPPTFGEMLANRNKKLNNAHAALLTEHAVAAASRRAGIMAATTARRNGNFLLVPPDIKSQDFKPPPSDFKVLPKFFPPAAAVSYDFCIPRNPVLDSLRLRAELNLYKLRTCRNIAGMERQLEPYAAPIDSKSGLPMVGAGGQLVLPGTVTLQPTSYRYAVLIERTKQLVQVAGQMETAMLAFLEKRDAEAYALFRARQDVRVSREGIRLQDLRVNEAESGVVLAELQQERSQIQADTYQEWITAGPNEYELAMIDSYSAAGTAQKAASNYATALQIPGVLQAASQAASFGPAGAVIGGGLAVTGLAALYSQNQATKEAITATVSAQIASVHATQERRRQEWELQLRLAQHDSLIGAQQIVISQDRVRVVGQERVIAQMQADHAEDVVEFLSNKFTGTELYDWMAGLLEGVYRYFLQQATSLAKLAEAQLAFERQEIPPAFIQTDYWEAATENGLDQDDQTPDRRGLTGSARLLRDIYQLDQYAFATNKRKLQLSKTISLAQLDPFAFQQFRQTGLMVFATPMSLYDRDFPGHYLRLIKRVRTSVIALVPPAEGIHATLSTGGIYRVAIGGDTFQLVTKPRAPESVALTAPINATGIFELDPQPEMLLPFEGIGVDTTWEFRMPKAANHFDYRTIADVLITIEYTALNSFDYRAQVVQEMDNAVSIDRPFSFRAQFADQWYDLHNPEQTATPMTVRFKTRREDFPPNIDNLKIEHVLLYFAGATETLPGISVVNLLFTELNGGGTVGGVAKPIECLVSTRKGNAGSWMSMLGKSPIGEWVLTLPDELKQRFKNDEIEDILFAVTCSGHTPEWPA